MFLEQVACDKSSLAYLFGCVGKGLAMAVDVHAGDEARFAAMAQARGVKIQYVVDTHIHADHVSGGRRLAALTGAKYALHESDHSLPFEFLPLADGQTLSLGNVSVKVLHTPGHTDDHICLLVTDHTRGDEPWFVLTGHSLFVGSIGRPDLHGRTHEMADRLYDSLVNRLLPGAQAGSACGGGISGKPCSTIGFEKRHNPTLSKSREQFIEEVSAVVLPPIDEIQSIIKINTSL
jgi:glyoxylase-like metal-dependent hydrolase (beta-lactamase superfamily II)